jgi:hypothetical protein
MSTTLNARILQSEAPLIAQNQKGAVAQDRYTTAYDGDPALADSKVFSYSDWVELTLNGAAGPCAATTPASSLLGVVPFSNDGIIDVTGFQQRNGFYTNLPVLKQGVIWVRSTGTINLGATLYLYVDPSDTTNYGKVRNGTAGGAVNISTLTQVIKVSNSDNLVLIDVNIL